MLTIRVIGEDGFEKVAEATSVHLFPADENVSESVVVFYPDDKNERFWVGTVYVMNSNGKTVAKYNLPQKPE